MIVIRHLNQIKSVSNGLSLSIGNFDGVHLGHKKIISEVKKVAAEKKLFSAILTFEPHPIAFLKNQYAKDFRITSLAQKLEIFREQKIDYAILLPFNQKIAAIEAEDFISQILVKSLNVKHLSVGYDFIFGKNRQGNFSLLKSAAQKFDFSLNEVSAFTKYEQVCSSSLVRKLINEGEIIAANNFLGRNFSVSGAVINGKKMANKIGFATANLMVKPYMVKPKFGVYKTITFIPALQKKFLSITNFGIKPTFDGINLPLIETHILNFNQNIYGKKIIVEFVDFIREEQKFESIEELKLQIERDLEKINKN
ncbi:MAG: bifunctional riboflavin kinase/FAD synthetase [Rickettsiales bacterium]|nr:bifunctional riboflavin kinase/FAD synthetase [Rickettsiales bacterium]